MSETNTIGLTAGWEARVINAAFEATKITFTKPRADVLASFGRDVRFDDNGSPFASYDGENLPLDQALTRFAYDHREVCDGRTLPRSGAGASRPGTESKSDYPTPAEKAARINEIGYDAWEKLPLTNAASKEILSKNDWYRLPTHEKVRRLAADPEAFNNLPNTPAALTEAITQGSRINHAALERQKRIRPASGR